MGKILSVLAGGIFIVAGLILLILWWENFISLMAGVVPPLMILGGIIALLAGISEFKDTIKEKESKK